VTRKAATPSRRPKHIMATARMFTFCMIRSPPPAFRIQPVARIVSIPSCPVAGSMGNVSYENSPALRVSSSPASPDSLVLG
jgi:hypothetical protein